MAFLRNGRAQEGPEDVSNIYRCKIKLDVKPCRFLLSLSFLVVSRSESGLSPRPPSPFPPLVWEVEVSREVCQSDIVQNNKWTGRMLSLTFPLIICACDVRFNHWVSLGYAELPATCSPQKAGTLVMLGFGCSFVLVLKGIVFPSRLATQNVASPLLKTEWGGTV